MVRVFVSRQQAKADLRWRFRHVKRGVIADVHVKGEWRRYGFIDGMGFYYELAPPDGQFCAVGPV